MSHSLAKIIGKAIFLASIQSSIGSVEMSSKFSVINFSKDQETLDNAAKALKGYMIVATAWTVGTMLVMYASYDVTGLAAGLIANAIMIGWIYFSYVSAFKLAAQKYGLSEPSIFC